MTEKDLIEGHVYTSYYSGQGIYIFRKSDSERTFSLRININNTKEVLSSCDMSGNNGFHHFNIPTFEQEEEFIACERAGKYVKVTYTNPLILF